MAIVGVVGADEQHERLVVAGSQHGDGVGLVEAGEVVERRGLPEGVLDVAVAQRVVTRGEDGGAAGAEASQQL